MKSKNFDRFPISYRLILNKCCAFRSRSASRAIGATTFGRFPVQYDLSRAVCFGLRLSNGNNVSLANLVVRQMFSHQTRASSRGRNAETSNEPPLNEFQFAVEKEIKVRSRHSRAEKHFAWNVTSAQNSGGSVGETKMFCARQDSKKTERRQVH